MFFPRSKSLLKLLLLILFLGSAFYLLRCTEVGQSLTASSMRSWMESLDPLQARLMYIFIYIVGTVLLVPGLVLSFAGAVLFGAYEGTLYTWIGATIGATLAFLMAKYLGREFVDQLLGGRFHELEKRLQEHGFNSLLVLRLLPWFPFNGINFGCGLTTIRLRDYILATAIGILPGTFIYQFLFAKLGDKMLRNEWQWNDLADPELGIAFVLFFSFLWIGRWMAGRMREAAPAHPETIQQDAAYNRKRD